MTTTYRTAGTTDDVTTCDLCGREELKGTVRLELVDAHGQTTGEVFAGTSCAAHAAGRPAAAIKREAREADRAARDAAYAAASRESDRKDALITEHLKAHGLERNYPNVKAAREALKTQGVW